MLWVFMGSGLQRYPWNPQYFPFQMSHLFFYWFNHIWMFVYYNILSIGGDILMNLPSWYFPQIRNGKPIWGVTITTSGMTILQSMCYSHPKRHNQGLCKVSLLVNLLINEKEKIENQRGRLVILTREWGSSGRREKKLKEWILTAE